MLRLAALLPRSLLSRVMLLHKGHTTDSDVKNLYIISTRPLDVSDVRPFVGTQIGAKALEKELSGCETFRQFREYRAKFSQILGIPDEKALSLLHKIQSAKELGDINALLDELQGWQGHMESERAVLAHRASHDTLTAMPNRHAFDEQLAQRIATAETRGDRFALLFIDADNFKAANDSFGHAAGDAVLRGAGGQVVRFDDHTPLAYGKPGFDNPFFIAFAPGVLLAKD